MALLKIWNIYEEIKVRILEAMLNVYSTELTSVDLIFIIIIEGHVSIQKTAI